MKVIVLAVTAVCSFFSLSANAQDIRVLCQSRPDVAVREAKGAPVMLMQFTGKSGLYRLDGVASAPQRNDGASVVAPTLQGVRLVPVQNDDVGKICAAGFDVSAILIADTLAQKDLSKTYVPPQSVLPTSFSIVGLWNQTWGNFWVPQALPYGHTYQVADFVMTPYNYTNSGPYSHLAVSVLTTSNSNLDADFDGKGAIFGGGWTGCPAQSVGIEAWAIQNWSPDYYGPGQPGCSPGSPCTATVYAPNSCSSWNNSQTHRFLVGANIWQNVVYWSYPSGFACPDFISPTIDTSMTGFRSGGAGVAFLHVLGSSSSVWSLTFTDAVTYTGP